MARHQPTEEFLARHGVDFVYLRRVELSRFDMKACQSNQARQIWKDPLTVEKYRMMYEVNQDPPAVVAYEIDGKLVTMDGNHRILAVLAAEGTVIDVYLVKTLDYAVIRKLTWSLNVWLDGLQDDPKMQLQHAVESVMRLHMTNKEASDQYCVSISAIERGVEMERIQKRFSDLNLSRAGIPLGTQRVLNSLDNDQTFKIGVETKQKYVLSEEESKDMVSTTRAAHTEDTQAKAIKGWVDARPTIGERGLQRAGVVVKPPVAFKPLPKQKWFHDFHQVVKGLEENPTCEKMGITGPAEWAELQGLVGRFNKAMPILLNSRGRNGA